MPKTEDSDTNARNSQVMLDQYRAALQLVIIRGGLLQWELNLLTQLLRELSEHAVNDRSDQSGKTDRS